jgi:type I restriction enzyme R subunit
MKFTEEDCLFFKKIEESPLCDGAVVRMAQPNPFNKVQLGKKRLLEKLMIDRLSDNQKIVTRCMTDSDLQRGAFPILSSKIFDKIRNRNEGSCTADGARP